MAPGPQAPPGRWSGALRALLPPLPSLSPLVPHHQPLMLLARRDDQPAPVSLCAPSSGTLFLQRAQREGPQDSRPQGCWGHSLASGRI